MSDKQDNTIPASLDVWVKELLIPAGLFLAVIVYIVAFAHHYIGTFLPIRVGESTVVELALTATSIFVSGILSLALVWLYRSQKQILSAQHDLAKAEHTPILRINSLEPAEFKPTGSQNQGDWLDITLSNVGNEVATEIEVEFLIAYAKEKESDYYVNSSRYPLKRTDQPEQFSAQTGEVLPAGESTIDYYAMVQFETGGWGESREEVYDRAFQNALDGFTEVNTIYFGIKIHYQSPAKEDYEIVLEPTYKISWSGTPPSFRSALLSAEKQEFATLMKELS